MTRENATMHLNAITAGFVEAGLAPEAVGKDFLLTASDGKSYSVKHYSDRVVLAAAFRVGSPQAVAYQMWATTVLAEFIRTGSVVDEQRLHIDPAARAKLSGAHGRVMAFWQPLALAGREVFCGA